MLMVGKVSIWGLVSEQRGGEEGRGDKKRRGGREREKGCFEKVRTCFPTFSQPHPASIMKRAAFRSM